MASRPRNRPVDAVVALGIVGVTVLVYLATAGPAAGTQSTAPHFVLQADAWLHGRLWIDPVRAARLGDVTQFGGHVYVAFPPLPALLMLPFVAVAGPAFNDARFTLLLGALNVGMAYLMARRLRLPGLARAGVPLGRAGALAVAALFAVGTVHFYAALMGRVWFTAHIVAVTCLLWYAWECVGRGRPLVAGLALAGALLARPPALFGAVFWLVLAAGQMYDRRRWAPVAWFLAPLGGATALLLALNALRFGNPLDFGYLSMRVAPQLAPDLRTYGQFNVHFLPRNVTAFLLAPPVIMPLNLAVWWQRVGGPAGLVSLFTVPGLGRRLGFPIAFDLWGAGLWVVSPALAFALRPPRIVDRRLWAGAWLTVLAVALPNLLYYNTGWGQYGYRFSLDFTPFLLVLVALGLRRPFRAPWAVLFAVLLAISVVSNFLGARWFLRLPPY